MWNGARVAVVIPAYDEELHIARTLGTLPGYVDAAYVVDDASRDATWHAAACSGDPRIQRIRHARNQGVGRAIASGYLRALQDRHEVLAVMAGDGQMDPDDLQAVIAPVAHGEADYVKGNRFVHCEVHRMPFERRLGGRALSLLTRAATGLSIDDSQCGYTALSARAAAFLPLDELWPRYGYPNDLLGLVAAAGLSVVEVPVRPVYQGEASGVRPWHVVTIAGVVVRRWWRCSKRPARFACKAVFPSR